MTEEQRTHQTLRVLELLDESITAYRRGDKTGADLAAQEACRLDVDCVAAVMGGITIGEIPNPQRQPSEWADYLQAAREHAAAYDPCEHTQPGPEPSAW